VSRQSGLDSIENPVLKKVINYINNTADTGPGYALGMVGTPGVGSAYLGATAEDALRQAKIDGAVSMFLGNRALRGTGSGQGGFSWQPGSATQKGASMIPLNSSLLGKVPEAGAHALINQLGSQGAFQYLMENVLTHSSADIGMKVVTEKNRPAISPGGSLNFSLHNFKVSLAIRKNPLVCKTQCLSKEGLKA